MIDFKTEPTLLFTPANKPERFSKAQEVGANGIILDLEDGVAEKDKTLGRECLVTQLGRKQETGILTLVRINHLSTEAGLADLLVLCKNKLFIDGLVYPKTESSAELNILSTLLEKNYPNLPILAFIETGLGVSQLDDIVQHSHYLAALLFGAADYAVDIGSDINMNAQAFVRMKIVQSAAIKQLACYDSPFFNFADVVGLQEETSAIKMLGFTGKMAIHPQQIPFIKSAFKPTDMQYQQAVAMVNQYELHQGEACQYEGKMIDVPVYRKAKQIIALFNNLST